MHAAANSHVHVAEYLVENGASVDAKDNVRCLSCQFAVPQLLPTMLMCVCCPVCQSSATALIAASDGGHIDVLKYLAERGADVNATGYVSSST